MYFQLLLKIKRAFTNIFFIHLLVSEIKKKFFFMLVKIYMNNKNI